MGLSELVFLLIANYLPVYLFVEPDDVRVDKALVGRGLVYLHCYQRLYLLLPRLDVNQLQHHLLVVLLIPAQSLARLFQTLYLRHFCHFQKRRFFSIRFVEMVLGGTHILTMT